MEDHVDKHKFNDDLLIGKDDREYAAARYPRVYWLLDHAELRTVFMEHDELAKKAKRQGRYCGLISITLIYVALIMAVLEQLFGAQHGEGLQSLLGFLSANALPLTSAIFGTAGALVGTWGVLLAKRKRHWLYHRMIAETIRQFHFQEFARFTDIAKALSSTNELKAFVAARKLRFRATCNIVCEKPAAEFSRLVGEEDVAEPEPDPVCGLDIFAERHETAQELFEAYRDMRISHQLSFANYMLRDEQKLLTSAPKAQAKILSNAAMACVGGLFLIHLFAIAMILLGYKVVPHTEWLVAIPTIVLALSGLAIRSLEEGLQPEREIERYQQYRSSVRAVLDRFDRAASPTQKAAVMQQMERLSFDEMRNFLVSSNKSKFVM